MNTASLFPMFLKLEGRNCLVTGAGSVGEQKIRGLLESGAKVRVVAPSATETVRKWTALGLVTWEPRVFGSSDLDGTFLVVVATSSPDVNHSIYAEARSRGILCNVVDDPVHCDFYYPAVVRRGRLQIAISTAGLSPALAQRIRKQLEDEYSSVYGEWLEELGRKRESLFRAGGDPELRRAQLHKMVEPRGLDEFERRNQFASGKDLL